MDEEEPVDATVMATCRTDGCGNKDIGIPVPDTGNQVVCGVCSQEITDID